MSRLSAALKKANKEKIKLLLSPSKRARGRRQHLTIPEEKQTVFLAAVAAKRGFAVTPEELRVRSGDVARSLGKPLKNGLSSEDWVRNFLTRHTKICFQKIERINVAKHDAQRPDHVRSYEKVLKDVIKDYPGIFDQSEFVLNMDKTAVSFGEKESRKAFIPSDTRYGGTRLENTEGGEKHVTAVIITSPARHTLPPFFIFAGKYKISNWFDPLDPHIFHNETRPHSLERSDWFPPSSFVVGTQNGSMEMSIIEHVISHIQKHYRIVVPKEKPICLLLDGYSSRNGIRWLKLAREANIVVVQAPNTSHFLQPNDEAVNRSFKRAIRATHKYLLNKNFMPMGGVGMKFRLGVAG